MNETCQLSTLARSTDRDHESRVMHFSAGAGKTQEYERRVGGFAIQRLVSRDSQAAGRSPLIVVKMRVPTRMSTLTRTGTPLAEGVVVPCFGSTRWKWQTEVPSCPAVRRASPSSS